MKSLKYIFLILCMITMNLYSQHLPLKIGNKWYYIAGYAPVFNHAAIAVDTVRINDTLYYKIEYRMEKSNELLKTTYDRLEGDSIYYRITNGKKKVIINFNWPIGTKISDSTGGCYVSRELYKIEKSTYFGVDTSDFYLFQDLLYVCNGDTMIPSETGYTGPGYSKYFGCLVGDDGNLIGAEINGITYGTILTMPVELISFSEKVESNSVLLKWSTATETNNYGFEILRSILPNDKDKSKVGFIKGNGTTTEKKNYEYLDKNLTKGEYEYQLVQIDYDGTRKQIADTKVVLTSPDDYTLYQNYPNPFNPTTKIEYKIPNESDITLLVYNILGEIIYKLKQSDVKAGKHEIIFNGKNLPSGIYYYQIRTTDFIDTKEMLLIK